MDMIVSEIISIQVQVSTYMKTSNKPLFVSFSVGVSTKIKLAEYFFPTLKRRYFSCKHMQHPLTTNRV